MEIYGLYTPTEFAEEIGVSQPRLSNVTAGVSPLSKEMAWAIHDRFPDVGVEFLWRGYPEGVRSLELAEKLRQYELRRKVRLFSKR
jgi:plasmid maintenance system antidote protein VapI